MKKSQAHVTPAFQLGYRTGLPRDNHQGSHQGDTSPSSSWTDRFCGEFGNLPAPSGKPWYPQEANLNFTPQPIYNHSSIQMCPSPSPHPCVSSGKKQRRTSPRHLRGVTVTSCAKPQPEPLELGLLNPITEAGCKASSRRDGATAPEQGDNHYPGGAGLCGAVSGDARGLGLLTALEEIMRDTEHARKKGLICSSCSQTA